MNSCDGNAEFSAVFSVTWSFRDHSNDDLCNKNISYTINVENNVAA